MTEPTMQADPLEAQTPSRSSAISIVSELRPRKLTFRVFASRCVGVAVLLRAGGGGCNCLPKLIAQRCFARLLLLDDQSSAHSAAAAIPAIAGTFSVPGRR